MIPRITGPVAPQRERTGTFAPAWSATGTAPALGNGILFGVYAVDGTRLTFSISLTVGSTTTVGTGGWSFGLPTEFISYAIVQSLSGHALDFSTQLTYPVTPVFAVSTFVVFPIAIPTSGGAVGTGAPFAWAANDTLTISGTILLA